MQCTRVQCQGSARETKNQVNERQSKVLRAANHAWKKEHPEVEFSQVKDAEKTARDTLDQLADKGLLDKRKIKLEGKGDVVLFKPYGAVLSKDDPNWPPRPEKR